MKTHRQLLLPAAAIVALTGCYEQILVPGDEENDRIEITNDEWVLDQRVDYMEEDVAIDGPAATQGGAALTGPARAPSSIRLRLIAEILPPTVNGTTIQATSVWATDSDKAIVSYNVQGGPRIGAIDYFTRLLNKKPKLRSSVTFRDSDVNSVVEESNWAVAALATDNDDFDFPAAVERIEIKNDKFRLNGNDQRGMASFAGTSVLSTGSEIYATSGDGGAVYAYDKDDFSLLGEYALDDARWVGYDKDNERVAVVQGQPGRIALFERGQFPGGSMNHLATYPFPGADIPEAKSHVEIVKGRAFIAAGPEGVQVMCLDNGEIVGSVPRPDPASVGLDPSVVQTNSVTVYKDLMFISNGEAGVYAAAADEEFDQGSCTDPVNITVLGRLRFDDLESVNHVVYRDDRLFIAAGLGGVKVVDVQAN